MFILSSFLLLSLATLIILGTITNQANALTTVPTKMNFQGRVTNASGTILPDGTYNVRLKIYSAVTAGTVLWSEDRLVSASQGIVVTNGQFSIQLGSMTSLPANIFTNSALYFEAELPTPATATGTSPAWTEGPMSPRNQLATSAYSFNSETLDGLDSADFAQIGSSNTFTGTNKFKNTTNSTSAFAIQDSTGTNLLVSDTSNSRIYIGNPTADATTTFLGVDSYNGGSADPAGGFNGSMYYNTTLNKLRCYENNVWKDCISVGGGGGGIAKTVVKLASDTNSAAVANVLTDVGLGFPVVSGNTYRFETFIDYTSAALTTGSRWTIGGPGAGARTMKSTYTLTATTQTTNYVAASNQPGSSNATSLLVGNIAILQGRFVADSNGTLNVQFASEVSLSAVTAKAGSTVTWWIE